MNYLIWGLKKSGLASLDLLKKVNISQSKSKKMSLNKDKIIIKKMRNLNKNSDFCSKNSKKTSFFYKSSDMFYLFDDNCVVRNNCKNKECDNVKILDELTKDIVLKMDKIILSPSISIDNPYVHLAKRYGIEVIGELELGYRYMDKSCSLVAITGTNGKTTTTQLVYNILQKANIKSEKVGNIGVPFCSRVGEKGVVYVCETSSFQLETCKLFHPNIACLINLSPDHLDRHKSIENYFDIKKSIFLNQTKKDFAIFPPKIECKTKGKIYNFGNKNEVKRGVFVKNGYIFVKKGIFCKKICNLASFNFFGDQYIEDVLCAVMIAKILKVKNKIICDSLDEFVPSKHRLQLVYLSQTNNKFFDDSKATNVDATLKAVKSFDSPTILLCGGSDKNCNFDELFLLLPKCVQKVFVFGETANKLLQSHNNTQSIIPIEKCKNLREAVYLSCQEQNKNILLSPACASFDEFSSYKERGEKFLKYLKDYYEKF